MAARGAESGPYKIRCWQVTISRSLEREADLERSSQAARFDASRATLKLDPSIKVHRLDTWRSTPHGRLPHPKPVEQARHEIRPAPAAQPRHGLLVWPHVAGPGRQMRICAPDEVQG